MSKLVNLAVLAALLLSGCGAEPTSSSYEQEMSQARSSFKLQMTGWVTDDANVIDQEHEERITGKLRQLERETKHQMAVVTVASLRGEDVATFTNELANEWGVGRRGYDDGVVVLLAPNERKVRIAVGYGLEKQLTDGVCRDIMEHSIVPHFRAGNLPAGVEAGVDALSRVLTHRTS